MTFAELLYKKRIRLAMTQPEMAAHLDLSLRAYCYYELGERIPAAVTREGILARIATLTITKPPK